MQLPHSVSVVATILALISSSMSEAGYTAMLSPEWMPVRSTCSMMPGIRMFFPVADGVNLDFHAGEVFVDEHRVILLMGEDDGHVFLDILVAVSDDHILAAQHIGRTHENRGSPGHGLRQGASRWS